MLLPVMPRDNFSSSRANARSKATKLRLNQFGINFAQYKDMDINHRNEEFIAIKQRHSSSCASTRVWSHDFSLEDLADQGFVIRCNPGIKFYLVSILCGVCMVPLLYSVVLSFYSLAMDPFEPFMYIFDMFLNFVRVFAIKVWLNYTRDAFRSVSYDAADQLFRVETRIKEANWLKPFLFSLSAVQGLEITPLSENDFVCTAVRSHPQKSYEIAIKLASQEKITLFPRVNSAQRARKIAAQIYGKTGIQLVSNASALMD